MKLKFRVFFPGAGDWTDLTHLVRHGSKSISRRIMNDERKSVVDSFRLELRHDNDLVNGFFVYEGRILAEVSQEDDTPEFTGYVAPTYRQMVGQVVESLELELLDNSYLLDQKLPESFQFPAAIGDAPFKVFDTADAANSIVHQVLEIAGYPVPAIIASGAPDITATVLHVAGTKDDETCRDFLDSLLFEHGYVLDFDAAGKFIVYHWDQDTFTASLTVDENFGTADGLVRTRRDVDYDGVKLEWAKAETVEGALLYRADLPLSTASGAVEFTGVDIGAGDYYPPDGDIQELFQDFMTKWLDIPYLQRETRLANKDISLITTSDHVTSITKETGVAIYSETYESHRARVLIKNSAGATKKLYTFEIHGKALYRKTRMYAKTPETLKLPKEYTSRFIFDDTRATRQARAMWTAIKYGAYDYSWSMRVEHAPGTVAQITLANPALSTKAIIIGMERNYDTPMFQYTAVGVEDHQSTTTVQGGGEGAGQVAIQAQLDAALSVVPSYSDLQDGYTEGGGTQTPTVPTLAAHGLYRAIVLLWDRQANLTNFDRYEVQVSPDAGSTWYPLELDGAGYVAGSPGADTDWPLERLTHSRIPFGGTAEAPTATTYHYQVRRVTKAGLASAWSTPASATTLLIETGDIAANAVTANKVDVGLLNALIASIRDYVEISATGGFMGTTFGQSGSPSAGARRAYLDQDEIRFQVYDDAAWQTELQLGGTMLGGGKSHYLHSRGVLHRDLDGPSGDFYPTGASVFAFDNARTDQGGTDPWDTATSIAYDATTKKFGTHSVKASALGGNLADNAGFGWNVGESVYVSGWVYVESLAGAGVMGLWVFSGNAGADAIGLNLDGAGTLSGYTMQGSTFTAIVSTTLTAGNWYHLALIYNGTTEKLYLVVGNTLYSDDVDGTWGAANAGTFTMYLKHVTDDTEVYVDDLCILTAVDLGPHVALQHHILDEAWSYSESDLLIEAAAGGRVVLSSFSAATVAALTSAGLTLTDDGGNVGLFLKDGAAGRIGLGTTDVEAWDGSFHSVLESDSEAIAFGNAAGGTGGFLNFLTNVYRTDTVWASKRTGAAALLQMVADGRLIFYTETSTGADETLSFVADLVLEGQTEGGGATNLLLGGGTGSADRDVTIGFASDASISWEESTSTLSMTSPGPVIMDGAGNALLRRSGVTKLYHNGTDLFFVNTNTTGTANMIKAGDSIASQLRRTTSSLAYKQDVRYSVPDELLDRFRSITFRSRCAGDDQTINRYGFGAEDMAALGDPALYAVDPETGAPNGVEWNAVTAILVARVQKHEARLTALEGAAK